ncbi:sugar phosphate isomerase/epimerase [Kribbella antibiotica]|uniref:Sugar phosphate isomerase/epimerase n=1 Tax=Kribbella antibiotica TaxID=190195 RepID=A0A4R4ZJN3_9ACTN|nr:sugar phosphate isomerase/epimerase family protein [Kribbella antibiotica]TDD58853.1 sugar phosphate isomerase/epimerase [Kribbella antibiotica]
MRRLAFSTLGCPGDPIEHVADLARRFGCGAVELRCADREPVSPDATPGRLRAVREQLGDIQALCVASYVQVARPDGDPTAEVLRHVEIAERLASPYVRVFGGGVYDRAVETLAAIAERITDSPVTVLLETHDSFLSGKAVAGICAAVDSPRIGALWDVVNPWRAGEEIAETARLLAPWLRHVQLKDVAAPDQLTPVLAGHGTVPLLEVLSQLDAIGYRGWLSLEWERAWYPGVPPLEEALDSFTTLIGSH